MGLEPATFSRATIRRHLFLGVAVGCRIDLLSRFPCWWLPSISVCFALGSVRSGVKSIDYSLP